MFLNTNTSKYRVPGNKTMSNGNEHLLMQSYYNLTGIIRCTQQLFFKNLWAIFMNRVYKSKQPGNSPSCGENRNETILSQGMCFSICEEF